MPAEDRLEIIREIMEDVFDTDVSAISTQTTAADIDEWDSLTHIRLIVAVERRFGVKFKNSDIESMANVGDLIKIIEAKLN